MKKFLEVVIFYLLMSNISFADLFDLKIDLNKSETTTEKIMIKNNYSSKCSSYLAGSEENGSLFTNIYGYSDKVVIEIIVKLKGEESGGISLRYSAKINPDGSIGKRTLVDKILTGSSEFKKEIKPYLNIFESMADMVMDGTGYYPDYGKPLQNTPVYIDGKKTFKKMINLIAKSDPKQSRQFKKAGSHIIKNSKINISKEFIGHSIINDERYNLIRYKFGIIYKGKNSEFQSMSNQFNTDQIVFFHDSGLPTIQYDIIPTNETIIHHSTICKIYMGNDLISEISVPILKDENRLNKIIKKTEEKEEKKLENTNIVDQLEKLNNLFKMGVITKEEFEKAKKKILN